MKRILMKDLKGSKLNRIAKDYVQEFNKSNDYIKNNSLINSLRDEYLFPIIYGLLRNCPITPSFDKRKDIHFSIVTDYLNSKLGSIMWTEYWVRVLWSMKEAKYPIIVNDKGGLNYITIR